MLCILRTRGGWRRRFRLSGLSLGVIGEEIALCFFLRGMSDAGLSGLLSWTCCQGRRDFRPRDVPSTRFAGGAEQRYFNRWSCRRDRVRDERTLGRPLLGEIADRDHAFQRISEVVRSLSGTHRLGCLQSAQPRSEELGIVGLHHQLDCLLAANSVDDVLHQGMFFHSEGCDGRMQRRA